MNCQQSTFEIYWNDIENEVSFATEYEITLIVTKTKDGNSVQRQVSGLVSWNEYWYEYDTITEEDKVQYSFMKADKNRNGNLEE